MQSVGLQSDTLQFCCSFPSHANFVRSCPKVFTVVLLPEPTVTPAAVERVRIWTKIKLSLCQLEKTHVPQLQFSVGTHMAPRSDWAALPSQLLADAFELQSNALDNCAAACVCRSWQSVVKSSFVSTLHLHVHGRAAMPSCLAQWRALLAARSSIGELKLTAGDTV